MWTPTWFWDGTQWTAPVSGSMIIPSGPSTRLVRIGSPSGSMIESPAFAASTASWLVRKQPWPLFFSHT